MSSRKALVEREGGVDEAIMRMAMLKDCGGSTLLQLKCSLQSIRCLKIKSIVNRIKIMLRIAS